MVRCEVGREPRDFARPAAGQDGDNSGVFGKAKRLPRSMDVGLEGQLVGQRVADEYRAQARFVVNAAFERKQAEHEVEVARHARGASPPPGPDLGADVLDRAQTRRMERWREAEVEFGRVDADEDIGLQGEHCAADACAKPDEAGKVMQHLEQPHDGELAGVRKGLAARGHHARTGDADKSRAGRTRTDRIDQRGTQVVSGGLAGDEADRKPLALGHQRMMLRSLAARKSTNGFSSGCSGTSTRSCSVASASLSPDR